jgi:hypothetical protein
MSIKSQFQAEFQPFVDAEVKHLDAEAKARLNTGTTQWYRHGPAAEHQFKREQLDTAAPKELAAIDQGLGKVLADTVTVAQRAYNLRYGLCRLDMYVKERVRCDQRALSLEALRDRVSKELTS